MQGAFVRSRVWRVTDGRGGCSNAEGPSGSEGPSQGVNGTSSGTDRLLDGFLGFVAAGDHDHVATVALGRVQGLIGLQYQIGLPAEGAGAQ